MDYRLKAFIQNSISKLPADIGDWVYYEMQRNFGGLKNPNPISRVQAAEKIWHIAEKQNTKLLNKHILEIGGGRSLILPLTLWMMGAKRVVSVDINRYFKPEILALSLQKIKRDQTKQIKNNNYIKNDRYEYMINTLCEANENTLINELNKIGIYYLAPCDARFLPFDTNTFQAHISYTVLEHIPREDIKLIIKEGKRVLDEKGLFIHNVDHTDHFSHMDQKIDSINFLKLNPKDYNMLCSNKFMYMNRMLHNEYEELWLEENLETLYHQYNIDEKLLKNMKLIKKQLYGAYRHEEDSVLATTESWYALRAKS